MSDAPISEGTDFVGICARQCEEFFRRTDRLEYFRGACRRNLENGDSHLPSALRRTVRFLHQSRKDPAGCVVDSASGTLTGFIKGYVDLAKLLSAPFRAMYAYYQESGPDSRNAKWLREACEQTPECVQSVARQMRPYLEIDRSGRYRISDSQLQKEIAGQSFDRMWGRAIRDRRDSIRECERLLGEYQTRQYATVKNWIKSEVDAVQRKILGSLSNEHPTCRKLLDEEYGSLSDQLLKYDQNASLSKEALLAAANSVKAGAAEIAEESKRGFQFFYYLEQCAQSEEFNIELNGACGNFAQGAAEQVAVGPELSWAKRIVGAKGFVSTPKRIDEAADTERSVGRYKDFIAAYATKKPVVSVEENKRFISLGTGANLGSSEAKNRIYVVRAHGSLKKGNDILGKDAMTAFNSFDSETFLKHAEDLKKKYPGLEITRYQTYNATALAIDTRQVPPEKLASLQQDIDRISKATDQALQAKAVELGVSVGETKMPDPKDWYRTGMGNTPDNAYAASRYARSQSNRAGITAFSDNEVQDNLNSRLRRVHDQYLSLSENSHIQRISETVNGMDVPKAEVFDLVRKSPNTEILADAIRQKYGIPPHKFTTQDANQLRDFVDATDVFSPAIFSPQREVLDLKNANPGAVSADLLGLGGKNAQATAVYAAKAKSVNEAIIGARKGELSVTKAFNQRKAAIQKIMGMGAQCSGDDCIRVMSRSASNRDKLLMVKRMASGADTRQIRMTFLGENIPEPLRMPFIGYGETVEKKMRESLRGAIPDERMGNLTIGVDMQMVNSNHGTINLVLGEGPGRKLTREQRRAFESAFKSAVRGVESPEVSFGVGSSFQRNLRLRPVMNPGGIYEEE